MLGSTLVLLCTVSQRNELLVDFSKWQRAAGSMHPHHRQPQILDVGSHIPLNTVRDQTSRVASGAAPEWRQPPLRFAESATCPTLASTEAEAAPSLGRVAPDEPALVLSRELVVAGDAALALVQDSVAANEADAAPALSLEPSSTEVPSPTIAAPSLSPAFTATTALEREMDMVVVLPEETSKDASGSER